MRTLPELVGMSSSAPWIPIAVPPGQPAFEPPATEAPRRRGRRSGGRGKLGTALAALLAAASKVAFSFVRDHLEVNDSTLSKQVSTLEQAGYVKVDKGFVGKRGRTWLSLTREGRRAFERHLAALREIAQSESLPAQR